MGFEGFLECLDLGVGDGVVVVVVEWWWLTTVVAEEETRVLA